MRHFFGLFDQYYFDHEFTPNFSLILRLSMSRRSDSKNASQITSLGGHHDDLRLVWMAQYICKSFPDIPDGKLYP